MFRLEFGVRPQFPSRTYWTPWRMATTGTAMTDSSRQPPLRFHQHLGPSWRWSGVSARATAHQNDVRASPRTCNAQTYVFATQSAKMTLTWNLTIANQMMTMTVNVLLLYTERYFLIYFDSFIIILLLMLLTFVTCNILCSIHFQVKT